MNETTARVAAVQWAPAYQDLPAGIEKARAAIQEAAEKGAHLVVFPETWLQGYPYWASISVREPAFAGFFQSLRESAVPVPGPEISLIGETARECEINVAISLHEVAGDTLYNSLVYISDSGELLGCHRKLVPTATERLVWGRGDGSDLAAYETRVGRLGGLLCFEHQMALARYLQADLGVQVHAACWPGHPFLNEIIDASIRQLAHENGCFVVLAREVMSADRLGDHLPDPGPDSGRWEARGGSAIVGPDGSYLAGPVFDEELVLTADIDLNMITQTKGMFDTVGHYARPDVFQLLWHSDPKPPVIRRVESAD